MILNRFDPLSCSLKSVNVNIFMLACTLFNEQDKERIKSPEYHHKMFKQKSSIRHFHIPHNTPSLPPKISITFVFHFPWVLQSSQEKLKTMLMQIFAGQTRCIIGDVEMANCTQIHWCIIKTSSGLPQKSSAIF